MRHRAAGLVAAIVLEALLLLLLLTLGQSKGGEPGLGPAIASFDVSSEPEAATPDPEDAPEPAAADASAAPTEAEPDRPAPGQVQPVVPQQTAPRAALLPVTPSDMAAADIARPDANPPAPARPAVGPPMGPPAPGAGSGSDTPRVGTAPNGEPLYAAQWYREPYDNELAGYLSTASGPGWALIVCRTVDNYRVEDCQPLEESPRGSNIARSVLAAAWQFQVRPPRIGGRSQVGAWVRIRIDYGIRRR